VSTKRAEQARLLRSAASALEHGRLKTASKKIEQALGGPLVIFVEGGLVQDVGRVSDEGFLSSEYDIVDYASSTRPARSTWWPCGWQRIVFG
jgi:hypothetical protein